MTNGQSTTISLNNISHEKAKTEKNSWKYLLSKLDVPYQAGGHPMLMKNYGKAQGTLK